jgi:hypothetical protein
MVTTEQALKSPQEVAGAERVVSPPALLQCLGALVIVCGLLAIAAGGGIAFAQLQQINRRPQPLRRSLIPLTDTDLLTELDPIRAAAGQPAVPLTTSSSPTTAPVASPPPAVSAALPAGAPAAPSTALSTGAQAQVGNLNAGECANVRSSPSLSGSVLHCLPLGSDVRVVAGPTGADGYRWWSVDAGGWIAETYLSKSAQPTPQATLPVAQAPPATAPVATPGQPLVGGYSGWATYYGIEDGFVRGDIMYDGTPYDPANPGIAAGSFLIPLHTWLLVCSPVRCIVVQVRDRGLLDQNGILLDLSRAAYAELFGGLGGKQRISALFIDPAIVSLFPALTAQTAAP